MLHKHILGQKTVDEPSYAQVPYNLILECTQFTTPSC